MNRNDITRGFDLMDKMIQYRPDRTPQTLYDKSIDYFLSAVKTALSEKLEIVKNDTLLSKELKDVFSDDLRLWMYKVNAFDYEKLMLLNYSNTTNDTNKKPDIQKINRYYYHFLKELKLNDIKYLNCFTFQDFQKEILQNEILGLPEIGESDIPSWMVKVKSILSDLVGFDNGLYYAILAANAYGRQLNEEVRPLSEKQKEHIVNYWKKGEIGKILLRKNQKVIELNRLKSPAVINDISSVPDDKVIERIISNHKGKVIFIDLWATWCSPCLDAMQEFRATKTEFRNKDVVFVYLTNGSSPRKLWEEKIKGIGDEHYYLTGSQWKYVMDHYGFEAIPSYLLYSEKGELIHKFTGFPGNDNIKKMINNLLLAQ